MNFAVTPSASRRSCRPRHRVRALATVFIVLVPALAAGCSGDATPATTPSQAVTTTGTTLASTTMDTPVAPGDTGTSTSPSSDGTVTTVTYSPPYTGTTVPGVPLSPFESNALARELKRTMEASLAITSALADDGASPDDPRGATVFALRARAQAITARRAIVDRQLPLADEAVRQLGRLLGEAQRTAEGDTAEALSQAQQHMALMAFPSQATLRAASALDYVIRDLAPLVPEETTTTS